MKEQLVLLVLFPEKANSKQAIKGKQVVMPVLPATPCLSQLNVCYSNRLF